MNIFIEPDKLSKDDFLTLLTDQAVDSEIRGWLADLFCKDNNQFDACELADYIITIIKSPLAEILRREWRYKCSSSSKNDSVSINIFKLLFLFCERAPESLGYFNFDVLNSAKTSFISDLVIYNFFQDYFVDIEMKLRKPNPNHPDFERLFLSINQFAVQDETTLYIILSSIEAMEKYSKDYLLATYWTEYIIAFWLVQRYEPIETFYEYDALIQKASLLLREKILEKNLCFTTSLIDAIRSIVKSDNKPLYHNNEKDGSWFLCKLFVSFNDNEKENE